jgi:hypothetical protein
MRECQRSKQRLESNGNNDWAKQKSAEALVLVSVKLRCARGETRKKM